MHELSLMMGVIDAVEASARENKASKVTEIKLVIGEMAEVLDDAMNFAFEVLAPGTLAEGASLSISKIAPQSRCLACGVEFVHDRYHFACPTCDSLATELFAGKEMHIDAIVVEN
ncbi:MAG: hydrogenase maturation nickel metallochaperone HypA [Coriobacteriia bacterium]|nr:hydrogenase maturation nickel metallochaperone HypA [Coriobacteriia bacterium]